MSELYAQRGLDFRTEMEKRAQDMNYISALSEKYGIPMELLYKPTGVQLGQMKPMTEDEPSEQEEPESEDMDEDESEDESNS